MGGMGYQSHMAAYAAQGHGKSSGDYFRGLYDKSRVGTMFDNEGFEDEELKLK